MSMTKHYSGPVWMTKPEEPIGSAELGLYSVEAEEATLGSILTDPEALTKAAQWVNAGSFYVVKNAWIWDAMASLTLEGKAINLLTLAMALSARGQLNEAGGNAYLAYLLNVVPTALDVESYARAVAEMATRRRLFQAAQNIVRLANDKGVSIGDMSSQAMLSLVQAIGSGDQRKDMSLAEAVDIFAAEFEAGVYGEGEAQLALKVPDLDNKLGDSLAAGMQIVIAGAPGSGKSALMRNGALALALRGYRVAYFSFEEPEASVVRGMASHRAQVNVSKTFLRGLRQTDPERLEVLYKKVLFAAAEIKKLETLRIFDGAGLTIEDVWFKVEYLRKFWGLDVVALDYLQIVKASEGDNREQQVAHISRTAKQMARRFGVLNLSGSQLNDNGEARESRAIYQDADAFAIMEADAINVQKNRHGGTGKVGLYFNKETLTIGSRAL